jgi:hypothetical protein
MLMTFFKHAWTGLKQESYKKKIVLQQSGPAAQEMHQVGRLTAPQGHTMTVPPRLHCNIIDYALNRWYNDTVYLYAMFVYIAL